MARHAGIILLLIMLTAPAHAAAWTVLPEQSAITFTGTQGGEAFTGTFGHFTATIDFDPDRPENGHISASVEMKSATTGDTDRDESLPESAWFNSADYPLATFTSKTIQKIGKHRYAAIGTLTIKGAAKEITLPFTLLEKDGITHAEAEIILNRVDFNIGTSEFSSDAWIDYDVAVTIHIAAKL